MPVYEIKEHEVHLFPIRYLRHIFGATRSSVIKKEARGQLPPANFKTAAGHRLYSVEDLAVIDYVYKEIWPYKQGIKIPDYVKEILTAALAQSKRVVVQYGKSISEDDWKEVDKEFTQFSRFRLQLYIDSWRRKLLDVDKFFPELVDDEDW